MNIWYQLVEGIQHTSWQEWISTFSQLLSVYYAKRNNVLVYPTGIIGVLLAAYVYLFMATPPLYADSVLNIYYFAMSCYGWYVWTRKKEDQSDLYIIGWCDVRELRLGILGFLVGWLLIYVILEQLTDSNTPILDSLVSSTAFTAMWWMANRKVESWLAWIVSNMVAIPLNYHKGFIVYVIMYLLFLVMACMGYRNWKEVSKEVKAT